MAGSPDPAEPCPGRGADPAVTAPATSLEPAALLKPGSLSELFRSFNRLALQGFGGVLPVAQRELVERQRWLTPDQFVEMLSIAQVLPGPNIVNMALMIGDRFFGIRGAFVALAGMMASPLAIVLLLAVLYTEYARLPIVADTLRSMGAVAAGLIIATSIKLSRALRRNPMGLAVCAGLVAVTFLFIAVLHWPLIVVLLALGPVAMATAWWKLR